MWAFIPARAYWISRMPFVDRSSKSGAQADGSLPPAAAASYAASQSRAKPVLVARYYVLTTAALALGLYDWLRHGTTAGWEAPEGTR